MRGLVMTKMNIFFLQQKITTKTMDSELTRHDPWDEPIVLGKCKMLKQLLQYRYLVLH